MYNFIKYLLIFKTYNLFANPNDDIKKQYELLSHIFTYYYPDLTSIEWYFYNKEIKDNIFIKLNTTVGLYSFNLAGSVYYNFKLNENRYLSNINIGVKGIVSFFYQDMGFVCDFHNLFKKSYLNFTLQYLIKDGFSVKYYWSLRNDKVRLTYNFYKVYNKEFENPIDLSSDAVKNYSNHNIDNINFFSNSHLNEILKNGLRIQQKINHYNHCNPISYKESDILKIQESLGIELLPKEYLFFFEKHILQYNNIIFLFRNKLINAIIPDLKALGIDKETFIMPEYQIKVEILDKLDLQNKEENIHYKRLYAYVEFLNACSSNDNSVPSNVIPTEQQLTAYYNENKTVINEFLNKVKPELINILNQSINNNQITKIHRNQLLLIVHSDKMFDTSKEMKEILSELCSYVTQIKIID